MITLTNHKINTEELRNAIEMVAKLENELKAYKKIVELAKENIKTAVNGEGVHAVEINKIIATDKVTERLTFDTKEFAKDHASLYNAYLRGTLVHTISFEK